MKSILIAALFIVTLAPTIAFGQISNYGLKVGIQSAGVYSDPSVDGRVLGFSIYGFKDWKITNSLFTTIDLGFSQKGFTNSQIETDETGQFIQKVEAHTKILYASLAPYLNIKTELANIQPYLGLAPRLDLIVNKWLGKYKFSSGPYKDPSARAFDKFAFGGSFVAGIKNLSIDDIKFRVEAKYEADITDSLSKYPREYRNNAIMLVLGINL